MLRIRDYLEMYMNCYTENKYCEIIINPKSTEETVLMNDSIRYIFK